MLVGVHAEVQIQSAKRAREQIESRKVPDRQRAGTETIDLRSHTQCYLAQVANRVRRPPSGVIHTFI